MTDKQFQELRVKISREYPVRVCLAQIAGVKLDDQTIVELFGWVQIHAPERRDEAAGIIRSLRTTDAQPVKP
jgi:hypothetical protein